MTRSSHIRRARASAKWTANFLKSEMEALGIKHAHDAIRIATDGKNKSDIRANACFVLGCLKPPGAPQALLRLARTEKTEHVVWAAFFALGLTRDHRVTMPLLKMLKNSTDPSKRQQIVYALWHLADARARPVFIELLSNMEEDETVRGFAAEGLGMLRPTVRSLDSLVSAVEGASVYVRVSALCGLSISCCLFRPGRNQTTNRAARRFFVQQALPAIRARLKDRAAIKGEGTVASYAASVLRNWRGPKRA